MHDGIGFSSLFQHHQCVFYHHGLHVLVPGQSQRMAEDKLQELSFGLLGYVSHECGICLISINEPRYTRDHRPNSFNRLSIACGLP